MKNELFRTDNLLKIEAVSDVKFEKHRTDGKKSREFYTVMFSDAGNRLKRWRTRNFFQQHTYDGSEAIWRGANPTQAKNLVGGKVRGELVSVPIKDGDNFSIVVFDGETVEDAMKSYSYLLSGSKVDDTIVDRKISGREFTGS